MKKIYHLKIKKIFNLCCNKIGILLLLCILFSTCTYRSFDEPKNDTKTDSAKEMSDFQRQLKAMRTADFDYIFAFRRKDGGIFTSEDKQFIKENSHYATNRFTLTKDEKAILAGSNFEFSEENLEALKERFEIEDFSKPAEVLEKKKKAQEEFNMNLKE